MVDENDARVSDLYATSPPTLKLTATVAAGLSDVNVRESFTSNNFDVAMSRVADAVVLTIRPLTDVAVAAPILGAVSVGDVRVLLVRICVSDSVTNLLSTEPSHPLQYPPELYHCIAWYFVTDPLPSDSKFICTPPSFPTKLFPFLNSILLSSTIKVCVFKIV